MLYKYWYGSFTHEAMQVIHPKMVFYKLNMEQYNGVCDSYDVVIYTSQ